MLKKTNLILVLAILLGGILLLSAGGIGYYIVRSRRHVKLFQQAMAAWEVHDTKRARSLFLQVLKRDTNNEFATVKLAEIAEEEGDWLSAGMYRNQACKLNELNGEYAAAYLHTLRMGRFFGVLGNYLKGLKRELTLDERAMLCYCQLMNPNEISEGRDGWMTLSQEKPEVNETLNGRLVKAACFSRQETIGDLIQVLESLATQGDLPVAQEALYARAQLERMLNRPDEEEKALKSAQSINYFTMTPFLGSFYSHCQRFDMATETMLPFIQRFYRANIAINVGEFMVLSERFDQFDELVALVNSHKDRKSIVAGYYIEALKAFHEQNFQRLGEVMSVVDASEVNSPLAAFMRLVVDTQKNDTARLLQDYGVFQKIPVLLDFSERANALVLLYIEDRLLAGDKLGDLSELIRAVSTDKQIERTDIFNSADLIDKLQKGILSENDLQEVIHAYDGQAGVQAVAVSFYYFKGNYAKALEMYDRLKKLVERIPVYVNQLAIDSLIRLDRRDEAMPLFRQILVEYPDESNARAFWRNAVLYSDRDAFVFLATLPAALREQRTELAKSAEAEELKSALAKRDAQISGLEAYKPFCEVAVLFLDGNKDEALLKLRGLDTKNPDLLYYKANQLKELGYFDETLAIYRSIPAQYSDYPYVLLNTATLLTQMGRTDEALATAQEAWKLLPEVPAALDAYIIALKNKNQWFEVLNLVNPSQLGQGASPVLHEAWVWAISARIQDSFQHDKLAYAKEDAQRLLRLERDNAFANDYLARIAARQKELEESQKAQEK